MFKQLLCRHKKKKNNGTVPHSYLATFASTAVFQSGSKKEHECLNCHKKFHSEITVTSANQVIKRDGKFINYYFDYANKTIERNVHENKNQI
jgi:transcriptional regulator NrdR family protein